VCNEGFEVYYFADDQKNNFYNKFCSIEDTELVVYVHKSIIYKIGMYTSKYISPTSFGFMIDNSTFDVIK